MTSSKLDLIRKLKSECYNCQKCVLYKNIIASYSPYVFGSGNVSAKIMLVGQNPGYNEMIQKKPFIGAAGKKLDICISEAGLSREDLYITNAVKCYTEKNAAPADDSVRSCRYYLEQEISIIQPKVIVILGGSSWRLFEQESNYISYSVSLAETLPVFNMSLHDRVLLTIHPSNLIYRPETKPILVNALQKAALL